MRVELPKHKKARIEIIPLIDVIFFCLATFVLVTLTMNRNMQLPVKLPVAQAQIQQDMKEDPPILLTVGESGGVYWNRDLLTQEQLRVRLIEYLRDQSNPKMLINGEGRAKFGPAVQLLDLLIQNGFPRDRVTFVTAVRPLPRA